MKVRKGFVSNSSSSSFVVAADLTKTKQAKVEVSLATDLVRYARDKIRTVKQLDKYLEDRWYEDGRPDWYNNAVEAITKGETILAGSFANDGDDPVEWILCDSGISQNDCDVNVTVIESEGGF